MKEAPDVVKGFLTAMILFASPFAMMFIFVYLAFAGVWTATIIMGILILPLIIPFLWLKKKKVYLIAYISYLKRLKLRNNAVIGMLRKDIDKAIADIENKEKWYGIEHTSDVKGVFGLPELHREEIKKAQLIANPGCFVTGAILSGIPLSKAKLVDRMIFDSKTGVSGAGISPTTSTHYPNIGDNVNPYKPTSHRHMPEIQQELGAFSDVRISFTPHLVPVNRGILTTNHSFLTPENEDMTSEDVLELYKENYKGEPFIKILEDGEIPRLSSVRGSNFAHIGCFEIDETGRLVVISAIDNLVKGASGQAVHNMNIMCGFDETTGLKMYGMHP